MKKRLLLILITFCTILLLLPLSSISAETTADISWYTEHTGTQSDPFILYNTEDLEGLAKIVNEGTDNFSGKYIKLDNLFENTGSLQTVIGNHATISGGAIAAFNGNFDGNLKTVKIDLDVTSASSVLYVGMFGYTDSGKISRVYVEGTIDINVTKKVYVGGLVGYTDNSSLIQNCGINVKISSKTVANHSYAGGIAGQIAGTTLIQDSYSTGKIYSETTTKTAMAAGIVAATSKNTNIKNCYSTGEMTTSANGTGGIANAAGIVSINVGRIFNCYSISSCYSDINNNATDYAGGIVGQNNATGSIEACYSTCTGDASTLVSSNSGTVKDCSKIDNNKKITLSNGNKESLLGHLDSVANNNNLATWREITGKNNNYPILTMSKCVAIANGVAYGSLQDAIYACFPDESLTISLCENIKENVKIFDGREITIELNGKTIEADSETLALNSYTIFNITAGTLDVKNGTIINTFKGDKNQILSIAYVYDDDCLFEALNVTLNVTNTNTTLDGKVIALKGANIRLYKCTVNASSTGEAIGILSTDDLYINNSIINSTKTAVKNSGDILLDGGEFNGDIVNAPDSYTLRISGGKYAGNLIDNADSLEVYGGIFSIKPDDSLLRSNGVCLNNYDVKTNSKYPYLVTEIAIDTSWYTGNSKDGTKDNPYLIHNTAQLEGLAKLVNTANSFSGKYIKLADDFDGSVALKTVIGNASAYRYEGSSTVNYYEFKGHFDGNSKEVKLDLYYNSNSTNFYSGMFGRVIDGEIKNLIVSGNIKINTNIKIYCGGLSAYVDNSTITNCCSKVNITAETTNQHAYCGGLVGALTGGGVVMDCFTTGNVQATVTTKTAMAAGIVGSIQDSGSVKNCYSRGNMTAKATSGIAYAAGIVALNQDNVLSCYATGTMTVTTTSGTATKAGLVANNSSTATVRKSYAAVEPLIGTNSGSDLNNYKLVGTNVVGKATVALIDQMNDNADKFDLVSWKIVTGANDGYPVHVFPKYAACIGDKKYRTIQQAIADCSTTQTSAIVIQLLDNVTDCIEIIGRPNIVIDLNGNTLTIDESKFDSNHSSIIYAQDGNLLIKNGTIKSILNKIDINANNAKVSIENCQMNGNFQTSNNGKVLAVSGLFNICLSNRFIDDQKRLTLNKDGQTKALYPYTLRTVATDTSWYDASISSYTLHDVQDLEGLAKLVNNGIDFSSKLITLASDFDNTGSLTTVIGDNGATESGNAIFTGTFNANNKTVLIDIDITNSEYTVYAGMFGFINHSLICNLTVEGTIDINVPGKKIYVGGIVGYGDSISLNERTQIFQCLTNVNINAVTTNKHSYAGGIIGCLTKYGNIYNSYSEGAINSTVTTQTAMAGGIAATIEPNSGIVNCYSTGNMTATTTTGIAYAAGLISINRGKIGNCYSTGNMTASSTSGNAFAAGLTGYIYGSDASIVNCYSKSSLVASSTSGKAYTAGIAGKKETDISSVEYCYSVHTTLFGINNDSEDGYCNYVIDSSKKVGKTGKKSSLVACLNAYAKQTEKQTYTFFRWQAGSGGYPVFGETIIAQVKYESGMVSYLSLQEAIDAIKTKNITKKTTITLVNNTEECVKISKGQNIELDLNSKTLTGLYAIEDNQATIYVSDNSKLVLKNGTVINTVTNSVKNKGGIVTIESGRYTGVITSSDNNLTINAGVFTEEPNKTYLGSNKRIVLNTDNDTRPNFIYRVTDKVNIDISWHTDNCGTSFENPYLIHNTAQLEGLAKLVNGYGYFFEGEYIKLADDFDGSVALKTVIGSGFWLLDSSDNKFSAEFKGYFDGNFKEVKLDLVYDTNTVSLASGMFGIVTNGEILNVIVSGNTNIMATRNINCGGLAGIVKNSTITNCCSKVNIEIEVGEQNINCGGLVGSLTNGSKIVDSYTTGNVNAIVTTKTAAAGGIAGAIDGSGSIKNCYSRGNMTAKSTSGNAYAAGIVALNEDYVLSCYSTGTMTATTTSGTAYMAGLVGNNSSTATVRKSYAVYCDPLIGTNSGSDLNNYKIVGKNVVGKSTVALIDQMNDNAEKFDLSPWEIRTGENDGYPSLVIRPRIAYVNIGTATKPDLKYFYSVQDAVDYCGKDVTKDFTITLLSNTNENIEIIDIENLTLDLNGNTITGVINENDGFNTIIYINESNRCAIKNGTIINIYNGNKDYYLTGINYRASSTCTLDNVVITIENNSNNANANASGIEMELSMVTVDKTTINVSAANSSSSCVGLIAHTRSTSEISNTTINSNVDAVYLLEGSIEITSGKFIGSFHSYPGKIRISGGIYSETLSEKMLMDDYVCVDNTDPKTKSQYPKMVILPDVAQIGEGNTAVKYHSLEKALEDAELIATKDNPVEIKIIFNIKLKKSVVASEGKNVTFNLNGSTVTAYDNTKKVVQNEKGFTLVNRISQVVEDTNVFIVEKDISFNTALQLAKDTLGENLQTDVYVAYRYDETTFSCIHFINGVCWEESESYDKSLSELQSLLVENEVYVIGEAITHVHDWSFKQGTSGTTVEGTCQNEHCTIEGGTCIIHLFALSEHDYDGTPKSATYGRLEYGIPTPEITYYIDENCQIKTTPENSGADDIGSAPVNPGTYYVKSANLGTVYMKSSFKINGIQLEVNGTTVEKSKIYDGTRNIKVTNKGTLKGVVEGDDVSIETVTAKVNDKNVGNNKAVTITYVLKGKDAFKYTIVPVSDLKTSISKRQVEVENSQINDKSYDGTCIATIKADGTLKGVIENDNVNVVVHSATFEDKNIGDNKTVHVVYEITGSDAKNYELVSNNTLNASILKTTLEVTGTEVECSKKGHEYYINVTNKGTLKGIVDGDNVTIENVTATFANEEDQKAGIVTVEYTLTGTNANNYDISPIKMTISVETQINYTYIIIGGIILLAIVVLLVAKRKKSKK